MLIPLGEATADRCGGKAGALGTLLRAGLPVPDGVVVPFAVSGGDCRCPPVGWDPSRSGRGGTPGERDLATARRGSLLVEALGRLGDPAVAVRSSAADEDTAGASAAGQHETALAVRGADQVADAVRACRASAHSARAVAYRGGGAAPAMAVLVQRLVDADVSGVLFTPAEPDGATVIEASWGLGPSVVGGAVTPDAYTVAADGTVTRVAGDKRTRLDRDGARRHGDDAPSHDLGERLHGDGTRPDRDGAGPHGNGASPDRLGDRPHGDDASPHDLGDRPHRDGTRPDHNGAPPDHDHTPPGGGARPDHGHTPPGDGTPPDHPGDRPHGDGTRLVASDVPVADRTRPALTDVAARELAAIGARAAELLGGPQDVEWAIADGDIWLLQSRPVTAAPPPRPAPELPRPPTTLTGTPGSHGTATGPVRVIRGAADFARLRPGDVLVCRYTDPAWTPLLRLAAGVVTEVGGVLSHAAIVAREQRIPAVLGVDGATTGLPDGGTVTVDGDAGTVTEE